MWQQTVVEKCTVTDQYTAFLSIFDKTVDNKASVATFANIVATKGNIFGHRCSKVYKNTNFTCFQV